MNYAYNYDVPVVASNTFSWNELVVEPLKMIGINIVAFLPNIVSALLILFAGWVVAHIVRVLLKKCLKSMDFDKIAEKIGVKSLLGGDEQKLLPHVWFSVLGYWMTLFVAFLMALDNLNLRIMSTRLEELFSYLMTVIVMLIIVVAGMFLSMVVSRVVKTTAESIKMNNPGRIANVARWLVLTMTLIICLVHIGLPRDIFVVVIGGTYLTLCITFILAFGIGGSRWASTLLEKFTKKIK